MVKRLLHRHLARGYETLPVGSEAMIYIASIDNLTRRITDETTHTPLPPQAGSMSVKCSAASPTVTARWRALAGASNAWHRR